MFDIKRTCCVSYKAFSTTGEAVGIVTLCVAGNDRPLAAEFFRHV